VALYTRQTGPDTAESVPPILSTAAPMVAGLTHGATAVAVGVWVQPLGVRASRPPCLVVPYGYLIGGVARPRCHGELTGKRPPEKSG
jgi:hypothetical protein